MSLATALVVAAAGPAQARTAQARPACPGAEVSVFSVSVDAARDTTLCLLNRERAQRGLSALRENARLRDSAQGHSRDMVDRFFFSHVSPGGSSVADRIRRTGYLDGARSWAVGENLAWGTGALSTPAKIVDSWMHSPGHRANVLEGRFREIGIGISLDVPVKVRSANRGATYTANFGARS